VCFCVCVCTSLFVEIMLQFKTSEVVSGHKLNIFGALYRSKWKKLTADFKNMGKNHNKLTENVIFYAKPVFEKNQFFYTVVT